MKYEVLRDILKQGEVMAKKGDVLDEREIGPSSWIRSLVANGNLAVYKPKPVKPADKKE